MLDLVESEQGGNGVQPAMSTVLWDTFTGSAPYRDIVRRSLKPSFILSLAHRTTQAFLFHRSSRNGGGGEMTRELGRLYEDGEAIITQGESGNCMYVIQSGRVEVLRVMDGTEVRLAELGAEDFFGEMALFTREEGSATVRAKGPATVLTVDRRTLLSRLSKDPTLALRIIERLSFRLGELNWVYGRVRAGDRRNWATRPDTFEGNRA